MNLNYQVPSSFVCVEVSDCRVVVVIVTASQVQPDDCATLTQPKLMTDKYDSRRQNDDDVSGYLASYYAQTLGHGRPDCPWTIAVRPGQRIQLTLIDFSADARYRVDGGHEPGPPAPPASAASAIDPALPDFCYRYAQVSEGTSTSRRYTVCAEETREQIVYTSSSNVLNVEITDTVLADVAVNFLIKYTGNWRHVRPLNHAMCWQHYCNACCLFVLLSLSVSVLFVFSGPRDNIDDDSNANALAWLRR